MRAWASVPGASSGSIRDSASRARARVACCTSTTLGSVPVTNVATCACTVLMPALLAGNAAIDDAICRVVLMACVSIVRSRSGRALVGAGDFDDVLCDRRVRRCDDLLDAGKLPLDRRDVAQRIRDRAACACTILMPALLTGNAAIDDAICRVVLMACVSIVRSRSGRALVGAGDFDDVLCDRRVRRCDDLLDAGKLPLDRRDVAQRIRDRAACACTVLMPALLAGNAAIDDAICRVVLMACVSIVRSRSGRALVGAGDFDDVLCDRRVRRCDDLLDAGKLPLDRRDVAQRIRDRAACACTILMPALLTGNAAIDDAICRVVLMACVSIVRSRSGRALV